MIQWTRNTFMQVQDSCMQQPSHLDMDVFTGSIQKEANEKGLLFERRPVRTVYEHFKYC